jgi:hypothetical protein
MTSVEMLQMQELFTTELFEYFGYDIVGSDSHPLKSAFELYVKMKREEEEEEGENVDYERICKCIDEISVTTPTYPRWSIKIGDGWEHVPIGEQDMLKAKINAIIKEDYERGVSLWIETDETCNGLQHICNILDDEQEEEEVEICSTCMKKINGDGDDSCGVGCPEYDAGCKETYEVDEETGEIFNMARY